MKAKILSVFIITYLLATFLASFLKNELSFNFFIIPIVLLFIISIFWWNQRLVRVVAISAIVFILALFRYQSVLPKNNENWINFYNGKEILVEGVVVKEPEIAKKTNLTIQVLRLKIDDEIEKDVKGNILVKTNNYPKYKFGDKLEIKGNLKEPPEFNDFSYKEYLLAKKIYSVMDYPEVKLNSQQEVNRNLFEEIWFGFKKGLIFIKQKFEESIEKSLPEPQASFMEGLLLGTKKKMPDWLLDIFGIVGITHIIALSGFNITVIADSLRAIFSSFSRRLAFWFPSAGIFSFVVLTGASASVARAAIMGFLIILARYLGRKSNLGITVLLAAGIMVAFNPLILRYDLGFQLSFLAVLGLVYLSPRIEKMFFFLPNILKEAVSLTVAAQVMVFPLLLYNFGYISLIAPLTNMIILPFIPITMLIGFISGVLGLFSYLLGQISGWLSWAFLTAIIKVAIWFSEIPWASIKLNTKTPIFLAVYCFIILDSLLLIRKRPVKA